MLDFLSGRLHSYFGYSVRLIIHGGALLLLQQQFPCDVRQGTEDVNFFMRAFVADVANSGFDPEGSYARGLLYYAIEETARHFDLDRSWMNALDDIYLPTTTE